MAPPSRQSYTFGAFRLDPVEKVLFRGTDPAPLTPKAVETLLVLVERHGRVVTKEELLRLVWPDTFVEEANLSVNVSALRKALGDQPGGGPYIETVPRRGYRFAATERPGPGLPTLAVLPFLALSRGKDDAYLGAGLADALITRLGGTGRVVARMQTTRLCRCGGSANKPFCDGTHARIGFRSS